MTVLWIAGLILEEVKEARRQGKERYLAQWWNIVTIIMLLFFIISGFLWTVGNVALAVDEQPLSKVLRKRITRDTGLQILLFSNTFFSIAFLLSFLYFSNIVQVNHTLGPLQISLLNMVDDISRFLALFLFVFVAFAMAVRRAYSQYVQIVETYHVKLSGPAGHAFARFVDKVTLLERQTFQAKCSSRHVNFHQKCICFESSVSIKLSIDFFRLINHPNSSW